jgi:hypothetical protein
VPSAGAAAWAAAEIGTACFEAGAAAAAGPGLVIDGVVQAPIATSSTPASPARRGLAGVTTTDLRTCIRVRSFTP